MGFYNEATNLEEAIDIMAGIFKDMRMLEFQHCNREEVSRFTFAEDLCCDYQGGAICLQKLISSLVDIGMGSFMTGLHEFLPNPLDEMVYKIEASFEIAGLTVPSCTNCDICNIV